MRRTVWLGAGIVLGAGGSLWTRRRLGALGERFKPARITLDVAGQIGHGARGGVLRIRDALAEGRLAASRREDELRQHLGLREPA